MAKVKIPTLAIDGVPPGLGFFFPLEANAPQFFCVAANEDELDRALDWIGRKDDWVSILEQILDLAYGLQWRE